MAAVTVDRPFRAADAGSDDGNDGGSDRGGDGGGSDAGVDGVIVAAVALLVLLPTRTGVDSTAADGAAAGDL